MTVRYFKLEPEVPGGWGDGTIADRSVHPPKISAFHLDFDGWLGDDLLESFPCFVVTERLADAMRAAQLSGYSLADVTITKSEQFDEVHPGLELPKFRWLKPEGQVGQDDISTLPDGMLVVSERGLVVFRSLQVDYCDVAPLAT